MPAPLKMTLTQEEDDTLKECPKLDVFRNAPVSDRGNLLQNAQTNRNNRPDNLFFAKKEKLA